jgi:two-component system chemotaxis sensor kinase CheA
LPAEGRTPVLVFADRERSMGLVVDEIVDIVEEKMNVQLSAEKPGLLGSAIVSGRATEVIDAGYFLTQAFSDWFEGAGEDAETYSSASRVLLLDDSPFFRNLLTPLLTVAGYEVTTVESARDALQLCEDGEDFDVIISDIEMPDMNGFEFAKEVRSSTRWRDTPLVALSGYTSQRDLERGREAGFSDYVAKFDREGLLQTLAQTLAEHRGAA